MPRPAPTALCLLVVLAACETPLTPVERAAVRGCALDLGIITDDHPEDEGFFMSREQLEAQKRCEAERLGRSR